MRCLMMLDNSIRDYAWGSKTALARLLGRAAATEPEAELWIGAHPQAPSAVTLAGRRVTLDRLVAERPAETLGWAAERFGPALPFLLKVLAVAEPLSIQAHPSLEQAAEGFAREDAAGISLDAPHRNYRDRNHKPEVAVALEPYWQLSGFRTYTEVLRNIEAIGSPRLQAATDELRQRPTEAALSSLVATALQLTERGRADLVTRAQAFATSHLRDGDRSDTTNGSGAASDVASDDSASDASASRWVERLAAGYPSDAGVLSPYLLNLVCLAPGEGIHIGAGTLHAALQGTAGRVAGQLRQRPPRRPDGQTRRRTGTPTGSALRSARTECVEAGARRQRRAPLPDSGAGVRSFVGRTGHARPGYCVRRYPHRPRDSPFPFWRCGGN